VTGARTCSHEHGHLLVAQGLDLGCQRGHVACVRVVLGRVLVGDRRENLLEHRRKPQQTRATLLVERAFDGAEA
jgi:hypothetical protein